MINFLGEPWTIFGLIISALFLLSVVIIGYWVIKDEQEYNDEFKGYGE